MRTIYRAVLLAVFVVAAVYAFAPGELGPDDRIRQSPQRGAADAGVEPVSAPDVVVGDPPTRETLAPWADVSTWWTADSTNPEGGYSDPFRGGRLAATDGVAWFAVEHSATLAGDPRSCFAPGEVGHDLDRPRGRRRSSPSS